MRRLRSRACAFVAVLALGGGAAAQEGGRDFVTPSSPPPVVRAPDPPPPPPEPEPEPAEAEPEPARPSLRTRSARPRPEPEPAARAGARSGAATARPAARPALAGRPPVRPTLAGRPAQTVRPTLARPVTAPRAPAVADRPAPPTPRATLARRPAPPAEAAPAPAEARTSPEARALPEARTPVEARPPSEPRPAPPLALAAGGSDGPQGELVETLRARSPRFRLVGTAGGQRSLNEVLAPLGADLAVTSTVALARAGAAPEGRSRLALAAKLFTEEVHVLARAGTGRLADLDGKPVAVGAPGSAAEIAARDLFEAAGVRPVPVAAAGPEALARLRSGEVSAVVAMAGRPAAEFAGIRAAEGLRLVPVPFFAPLQAEYYPASLSAADYPGLIGEGERVDTVAAGAVLVAPGPAEGAERQARAAALVQGLFQQLPALARSGHPKWREVNLGATLPDWPRFEPARRWLSSQPAPSVSSLRLDEAPR